MICVIYGTTGELIKLAPVLKVLQERDIPFASVTTAQQVEQIPELLTLLGLPRPDVWLAHGRRGRDLRTTSDVPSWLAAAAWSFAQRRYQLRRILRSGAGRPLVLVQGDTMTTVLGALVGRNLGATVAHVESGLRSWDLFNPFPEELDRRVSSRLADILYAPGGWAASNLRRGIIVDTGSNTIRDSLALAGTVVDPSISLPPEPFGMVSLHRFELLRNRPLLAETLDLLADHARHQPLLFIDHPVTVAALVKHGLSGALTGPGFRRFPRLPFLRFIPVLRQSAFIVTDSGGNQEESFYLDIPCLVHRKRTERRDGLDENVVLSGHRTDALRAFLQAPDSYHRRSPLPEASPSRRIVDDLVTRGFAAPR